LFCNRCGYRNPEGANFCSSCGSRMERSPTGAEPTTTSLPALVVLPGDPQGEPFQLDPGDLVHGVPVGGAVLVVTRGPNSGSRFVLTADDVPVVTIGRHPDSDIFLDDITVSRRHAEVCHRDGSFWVHDVGSLNGTYVNRHMMSQDQLLASGDEVQVGKFRLLFLAPGANVVRAPRAAE
jgi:pSer/pThr/pTyr-binding forkhead associated (FHA) protein